MTTGQLIILDHAVALVTAAAWLGAGATAAARRSRVAALLLGVAMLATLGRTASTAVLAGRGWWFVQEKVTLGLPMLIVSGVVAVALAGPALLRARPETPPAGMVSLLTAGYAGLAGFVVTFLVGYPLTWSVALIAVALVVAAAMVTWRVVAPPAAPQVPASATLSRRRFLGVAGGAVAAGAGVTGIGLAFVPAGSMDTGGGPTRAHPADHGVPVGDLRGPGAPAAGGSVRRYTVTAQHARLTLPSGREADAMTFDGQVPGPPLTASDGDLVEVTLRNADIDEGVTLHWHGYDVACGEDGAPGLTQEAVAPGGEFVYRFQALQVGTYWYHTHQVSALGVRRGLYGTLVVTPRDPTDELDLTLPVHTLDGVTLIGDTDQLAEHDAPAGTAVRLRLVNTDSVPHRFAVTGCPFRVVAVDGRDLNEPGEVERHALRLPAGGRCDVTFTMPEAPVALVVDGDDGVGIRLGADPNADASGTAGWPELDLLDYGAPADVPFGPGSRFDRDFTLVLDRGVAMVDGRPAYAQIVNGLGHPSIPEQLVTEGDLVRFTVVNRSLETHPWHLHGHAVLVLSRDGREASGSPLWVDTFDVQPGEVWEVGFRATNPGLWMNHCHNLPHAEQGMMLHLAYDGVTARFDGSGHDH